MFKNSFGNQLQKRKELLYNLGAISSYTSMLIFLWHGIEMLVTKEQPKHTLLLYAGSSFFSILVMAPYKWDKKWMRIKTSVGMVVFGCSFIIYLICLWINWFQRFNQNFLAGGTSMGMPTMFQVPDVDSGEVRWVNADLATQIVPRVWTSAGKTLGRDQPIKTPALRRGEVCEVLSGDG